MTTYAITTRDSRTVTRVSDTAYTHAAVHVRPHGRHVAGDVTFHRTHDAAVRAAGRAGYVVAVDATADGACVVCGGAKVVRYGPSAVDGTYSIIACHRCAS